MKRFIAVAVLAVVVATENASAQRVERRAIR